MCSPSWTLLPPPSAFHPSGSSQCTSPKHPVSCIEPGLATRFIHDILHVSMPFSLIFLFQPSSCPLCFSDLMLRWDNYSRLCSSKNIFLLLCEANSLIICTLNVTSLGWFQHQPSSLNKAFVDLFVSSVLYVDSVFWFWVPDYQVIRQSYLKILKIKYDQH